MAASLAVDEGELRSVLRIRSDRVASRATGALSSFLIAAADPMNSDDDWLQRVGTALVGKAPKVWNDEDEILFESRARESIGAMHRLEFLFGASTDASGAYRICLTFADGTERVFVGSSYEPSVAVSAVAAKALSKATEAGGPGGALALVRELIERVGLGYSPTKTA